MSELRTTELLPDNASQLERDLDTLFDHGGALEPAVAVMRTAKYQDIPDSFVPWLVYEYGLEEILPWVTDPRQAMRSGIQWQRVRGTPESLRLAMSWVGFVAKRIEEEEPGRHYYEFQIEIEGVIIDAGLLDNIIQLSTLSAPIRSRLSRIYNAENDVRRFRLDYSPWGDLLSDYSGIHTDEGVRLSFGRITMLGTILPLKEIAYGILRQHDISFVYRSGFILDYSDWGEIPILENKMQRGRLQQYGTEDSLLVDQPPHTIYTFAKSLFVLSDDNDDLSGFNAELSGGRFMQEFGETFILSDSKLSEVNRDMRLVNIDERFDNRHGVFESVRQSVTSTGINRERQHMLEHGHRTKWPILDVDWPVYTPKFIRHTETSISVKYEGQFWTGVTWSDDETWESLNVIIGVNHVSSS